MPRVSRFLVRAALVHLVLGSTLGAMMLASKAVRGHLGGLAAWLPLHADVLLLGFLLQVLYGVATWILPREADRTPSRLTPWAVFVLVNAGLAVEGAAQLAGWTPGLLAGRAANLAAAAAFALHALPRVRPARFGPASA